MNSSYPVLSPLPTTNGVKGMSERIEQTSARVRGAGVASEPSPTPRRYVHLIGGESNGVRHEVGDAVDASPRKVKEWLDAGIIKPASPTKSK